MNLQHAGLQLTLIGAVVGCLLGAPATAEPLGLKLRYQQETAPESGRYHRLTREEQWKAEETAVIVCDVWDAHHCLNAVRRVKELAPRLNKVLVEARRRGATIIHAPSDCMDAYANHPARRRAVDTPRADRLPEDIDSWCSRIPAEERGEYPIDQSDGGEDDDPAEHAAWAAKLKEMGRDPNLPWEKQYDVIAIDPKRDFLSDRGEEIWNILEARGIKNVILTGVHTNMCVLGRPFGLRQMARNGKNVVLMRDMTDTMYNPQRWPYVSHFTGTDLIVSHIEKFVCPTITSDQLIGGATFRFAGDRRPHLVIVMAEDEYKTEQTLPKFAAAELGKQFRVSYVFGSEKERHRIPGLEVLDEADLALFSVRRRWLPEADMRRVRRFVESGKPVLGIRTASHAFEVRNQSPPEGFADWPEFDAAVFGGNYHGHHANQLRSRVEVNKKNSDHPILRRFTPEPFEQGGSLYQTSPLADGTTVLLAGEAGGKPIEPVAWTFRRADKAPHVDGGRSFYTSLGHVDDFANPQFVGFLRAAIAWAAGLPETEAATPAADATSGRAAAANHWSLTTVPVLANSPLAAASRERDAPVWLRCAVRFEDASDKLTVRWPGAAESWKLWCNGHPAPRQAAKQGGEPSASCWTVDADWLQPSDANLIVLRCPTAPDVLMPRAPVVQCGERSIELRGRWQFRLGDDPSWSNMPLPAKFGAATDIVYQP